MASYDSAAIERMFRRIRIAEDLRRQACRRAGVDPEAIDHGSMVGIDGELQPMWRHPRFMPTIAQIDNLERGGDGAQTAPRA